jgi:hypothetical protein
VHPLYRDMSRYAADVEDWSVAGGEPTEERGFVLRRVVFTYVGTEDIRIGSAKGGAGLLA